MANGTEERQAQRLAAEHHQVAAEIASDQRARPQPGDRIQVIGLGRGLTDLVFDQRLRDLEITLGRPPTWWERTRLWFKYQLGFRGYLSNHQQGASR